MLDTQYPVVFPAVVGAVERLGAENHVYLNVGNQVIIARGPGDLQPAAGERVFAAAEPDRLYFFDAASDILVMETPGGDG